jgi:hypothetical protein
MRTRGEMPTGADDAALKVLFREDGASIADIVPAELSVHASTSDPLEVHDCFASSGYVIVSSALKELVEKFAIPNTEFFPLKVITIASDVDYHLDDWRDGITLDGYWMMNCWNRLDATQYIDFDASILHWQKSFVGHRPPWIRGWDKLCIKRQIEEDLYCFEGHLPRHRYVSERFKEAADAAGLRAGIYERPLKRWWVKE